MLRELRAAQADFEQLRRRRLPYARMSRSNRCDERVGRFCYWYDEEDAWEPTQEHHTIVLQRDRLLSQLDSAAAVLPGDGWIAGQRVRYLVEAGRAEAAIAVARSCRAAQWWCLALEGFAHHVAQDFAAADGAFEHALRSMTDERRCEWNDVSLLLEHGMKARCRKLDCGERSALERRFWWLADPFYSVPGNERRTEHYARLVMSSILEASASVRRVRWGRDSRELLLRYGWSLWWERERPSAGSIASRGAIIGHHRKGERQFVPSTAFLEDPSTIAVNKWDLDPVAPHTRYAAPYARYYSPLEHHIAVFRRGDSAVVVARVGWMQHPNSGQSAHEGSQRAQHPSEQHANGDTPLTTLAATENDLSAPIVVTNDTGEPHSITVPRVPLLLSLEVLSRRDSVAGRERAWIDLPARLPDGFAMSDILLLEESESHPLSLDEAIPLTRPAPAAGAGERVGLYWELYGLGTELQSLDVSLTVEYVDKGFIRRAAEWLGIVGHREDAVRLRWRERALTPAAVVPRSIAVQLADAMEGSYVIRLTVNRPSGQAASTTSRLTVR